MKVVAAFLLAVLGGNPHPSAEDIKDILGSVGAEADDERIDLLLADVKGKEKVEEKEESEDDTGFSLFD